MTCSVAIEHLSGRTKTITELCQNINVSVTIEVAHREFGSVHHRGGRANIKTATPCPKPDMQVKVAVGEQQIDFAIMIHIRRRNGERTVRGDQTAVQVKRTGSAPEVFI
jgi:hypothetical protein